jgi:class 3 adenylate cyclase
MPRDPRAYTPRHLAEKILTTRSALEGERKHLSILFVDVVDSMRLAEKLDAEEWHRVLDRVFEILAAAIHGVEGTINQFTGDGVMALFGAPVAHEDHARRACQAALAARDALRAYAETLRPRGIELAVRFGINSDEVVVGKIGDDLRMDYTAQGQSVGLAARMQQLAEPGTVLLTETTARLVEGFCVLSDASVRSVKGVSAPIRVFELAAMGPARTRLAAAARRGLTRLIGRDTELTWLEAILARSIGSDGQVVGVVGEAGVGKSRLCLEFGRRCRARDVALYETHCPAHAVTVPRFAIRDLLRSFLGLSQTDDVEATRRSVAEELGALDAGLAASVPLVLDVLGVGDGVPEPSTRTTTDLAGFMRRLLRLRSAAQPALVLIDDAHWMDPASHELVRELAAAVRGTRTLLLTNFRPEYRPAWTGGSHYHQLALSPLGAEAARELLDELLGSHGALGELAASILERTGGNPFFTEEVVQALVGAGNLVGERGAYRLAAPIASLALPPTVQALLASRIDRLGEVAKQVLQAAAVIGKQFDEPLLREASGVTEARELDAALADLEDLDFVRLVAVSPHPVYTFKHPLMADVAYRSQLGERRAQLHAAVAAALEKLHVDRLGEHAALIAHHWEASGMRFEASRWKRRAALNVANIKVRQHRRRPRS